MRKPILFTFLLAVTFARAAAPAPVDLLLVGADDATLQPILRRLDSPRIETHAAWTFWSGSLAGKTVVVTRTEGDPLNAVAATTLALRRSTPRLLVVFGTSRAHDPALRPGDLVVSEAFCPFDGMISPVTELGAGSDSLTWRKLLHPMITPGEIEARTEVFPADAHAVQVAATLANPHGRVLRGTLGSAPQINREADRVAYLRTLWGTSTEDGESAHVAACATLFIIPVLGLRVVEGPPAQAAEFVMTFVEAWK